MNLTITDLLHPEVKRLIATKNKSWTRNELQLMLPVESMNIISGVHLMLCDSDPCKYTTEETIADTWIQPSDTWIQPSHIFWTDATIALMNKLEFMPRDWATLVKLCFDAQRILSRHEKAIELFTVMFLGSGKFLNEIRSSISKSDSVSF